MREVRFRAWDNKEKRMYDWANIMTGFMQGFFNESYDVELMQYTGLKDKNGKEVYEGDIAQFYRHSDDTRKHEKTDVSEIKFRRGAFCYNAKYVEERTLSSLWRPGESMEVIGNIFENSDLLNSIR